MRVLIKLLSKILYSLSLPIALLFIVANVASAQTVNVSGNGENSYNQVNVTSNNSLMLNQSNTSYVTNTVNSTLNTGGNTVNGNTGSNIWLTSGPATFSTNINNTGNSNSAKLSGCNTCGLSSNVTSNGNGEGSRSIVNLTSTTSTSLNQNNNTTYNNQINQNVNTRNNTVSANTDEKAAVTQLAVQTPQYLL